MEAMPDTYATDRWQGNRTEEPYVRCPVCTATFPARAFEKEKWEGALMDDDGVPDVRGMRFADACALLLGMKAHVIARSCTGHVGTIYRQLPMPGDRHKGEIDLWVGDGQAHWQALAMGKLNRVVGSSLRDRTEAPMEPVGRDVFNQFKSDVERLDGHDGLYKDLRETREELVRFTEALKSARDLLTVATHNQDECRDECAAHREGFEKRIRVLERFRWQITGIVSFLVAAPAWASLIWAFTK
jgi:hypothetical protein